MPPSNKRRTVWHHGIYLRKYSTPSYPVSSSHTFSPLQSLVAAVVMRRVEANAILTSKVVRWAASCQSLHFIPPYSFAHTVLFSCVACSLTRTDHSLTHPLMHSLIRPLICPPIHSLTHLCIHWSLTHALDHSLTHYIVSTCVTEYVLHPPTLQCAVSNLCKHQTLASVQPSMSWTGSTASTQRTQWFNQETLIDHNECPPHEQTNRVSVWIITNCMYDCDNHSQKININEMTIILA